MARPTRGVRAALAISLGLGGLVISGAMTAAVLATYIARVVVTPPRKRATDIVVLSSTAKTVTLSATTDTRTPGRYTLWFSNDTGRLRIGAVLSSDGETVTRELLAVDEGVLATPTRARFSGWYFQHPAELGLPSREVAIPTAVGVAPAWLVPAEHDSVDWVIQVHGRGVTRAECIRAVPVFHDHGFSSLLVSYRNDGVAPNSVDHRYALGGTEWLDVEAAIEFAIAQGAKNIVLMGWSMGGATSLQVTIRSSHRDVLRGLVLESPVVDWRTVLDFQAAQLNVPLPVRLGALALLGSPWGKPFTGQAHPIDLDSLNIVKRASELSVPTLLMHSADDGYVPPDSSRALAALRPDLVRYEEFTGARHAKLWNYDEERFNRVIAEWLVSLRERVPFVGA